MSTYQLKLKKLDNDETVETNSMEVARTAKMVPEGPEFVGSVISNMVNGGKYGIRETGKGIARGIGSDHRTLQQMGISVLVQALAHYHKECNGTDDRNDAAFKFSRAFYAWVKEGEGSELYPFPMI